MNLLYKNLPFSLKVFHWFHGHFLVRRADLVVAALCFYLKDIFDSADGQLARAKQLYSRHGRFLDSIGDYVVDSFCSAEFSLFFFETE